MRFSEWTDEKLIEYAKALHFSIYVVGFYRSSDLINYDIVMEELEIRGYRAISSISFIKGEVTT